MSDLEIGFKLFDQVIVFWQFYIVGVVGVVGWVFSRSHAWPLEKRIGVSLTFTLFSLINISALYKTTTSLSEISDVLGSEKYQIPPEVSESVFNVAAARLDAGDWWVHIAIHLIADITVLFFIFGLSRIEQKKLKGT